MVSSAASSVFKRQVEVSATFSFIFGEVNVLVVHVCVAAIPTSVSVTAGSVSAVFPEKSECAGALSAA